MEKNQVKRLTNEEIKAKVLEGMMRARKKLIEKARKDDACLVIYENGKVVKISAKDLEI